MNLRRKNKQFLRHIYTRSFFFFMQSKHMILGPLFSLHACVMFAHPLRDIRVLVGSPYNLTSLPE